MVGPASKPRMCASLLRPLTLLSPVGACACPCPARARSVCVCVCVCVCAVACSVCACAGVLVAAPHAVCVRACAPRPSALLLPHALPAACRRVRPARPPCMRRGQLSPHRPPQCRRLHPQHAPAGSCYCVVLSLCLQSLKAALFLYASCLTCACACGRTAPRSPTCICGTLGGETAALSRRFLHLLPHSVAQARLNDQGCHAKGGPRPLRAGRVCFAAQRGVFGRGFWRSVGMPRVSVRRVGGNALIMLAAPPWRRWRPRDCGPRRARHSQASRASELAPCHHRRLARSEEVVLARGPVLGPELRHAGRSQFCLPARRPEAARRGVLHPVLSTRAEVV